MTDKIEESKDKSIVPYREPTGGDAVKAFIPNDFASVFRFSQLLAESGDMVPKAYINNPAKIATAIFFGYEIGLLPLQALQSIAVINGKPSIYGDAALALVRASGQLEDFEEYFEGEMFLESGKPNPNYKAVCKVTRKGAKRATVSEFSIGDAILANLWNKDGPWRNYPKRMLQMRARGFALRDEFTDVLRGLILAEEAQDYDDMRDITPGSKEPPAPDTDADENSTEARPRRGRPRKADVQAAAATDGKTIEGTVEHAAAGEAKQEATTTAQTEAAKTNKAATETKTDDAPVLLKIVPNFRALSEKLRAYITNMHATMSAITDIAVLKTYWQTEAFKGWTPDSDKDTAKIEDTALKAVSAFHKNRITEADDAKRAAATKPAEAAAADGPPDPDGAGSGEGAEFNFDGWLKELEGALTAARSPDEVTKIYGDFTEIPFANNLVSDDQMEKVTALAAEHMRRVEF